MAKATKATNDKLKELAELLAQKEIYEAKHDFWKFCKYMDSSFFNDDKPHLKLIAEKLQDVEERKITRLAISMPPRFGKSYITTLFTLWTIGRNPEKSVMRNSYTADLAEEFSFSTREMIQSEKYLKVFPKVRLREDKKAIGKWSIVGAKTNTYFCAGVGGSITGKGVNNVAILDDPIKGIEEALSETVVSSTWRWYKGVHQARMEDDCAEIHIATRWCKQDPIGRITDPDGDSFDPECVVLVVPALDEHGESTCPAIHTTDYYKKLKVGMEDFIWEAEFMQHPIEEKGLLFPISDLHRFSMKEIAGKTPDGVIGHTDTADLGSDFLSAPIGCRFGDRTYITDVVFTQDGVEITEPLVANLIIRNKCQMMQIESNNGGRQFSRNVRRLLQEKGNECSITSATQTKNKETRILMMSGYIKEHFWFRNDYEPGSDYDKFMRQVTRYVKLGRNTHDDGVDSLTSLAELVPYRTFEKPQEQKHYNFDFEREANKPSTYLSGELTDSYMDFMGGR